MGWIKHGGGPDVASRLYNLEQAGITYGLQAACNTWTFINFCMA